MKTDALIGAATFISTSSRDWRPNTPDLSVWSICGETLAQWVIGPDQHDPVAVRD